jgi:hypothetical protein
MLRYFFNIKLGIMNMVAGKSCFRCLKNVKFSDFQILLYLHPALHPHVLGAPSKIMGA